MEHIKIQFSNAPHISVKKPKSSSRVFKNFRRTEALSLFQTILLGPREKTVMTSKSSSIPSLLISKTILRKPPKKSAIKWYMTLKAVFERVSADEGLEMISNYFRTYNKIQLLMDDIKSHLLEGYAKILKSAEEFTERVSVWIFSEVTHLELKAAKYYLFKGSSYIELHGKTTYEIDHLEHTKWRSEMLPVVRFSPSYELRPRNKTWTSESLLTLRSGN